MGQLVQDLTGMVKVAIFIVVFAVALASSLLIIAAALIVAACRCNQGEAQNYLDKPLVK